MTWISVYMQIIVITTTNTLVVRIAIIITMTIYTHIYIFIFIHMHTSIYSHIHHTCTYIYIYVYKHWDGEGWAEATCRVAGVYAARHDQTNHTGSNNNKKLREINIADQFRFWVVYHIFLNNCIMGWIRIDSALLNTFASCDCYRCFVYFDFFL